MRRPQGRDIQTTAGAAQFPGGDLTLAELQEMSSRQQQQMEAQQQVLVAKEQRLKYLRQQEAVHAQHMAHNEQVRWATERVESQEMKLRKLRALRGQAEQYRQNNGQLTGELEAVRAVFNEKEKELALAVARVDQLTRQLQDLRSQQVQGSNKTAAALELEKLKNELLIRNKLNEQQTHAIAAKAKLLSQRKEEVTRMDARIHELQQRLKKRRSQEQQAANRNTSKKPAPSSGPQYGMGAPNVATVEPYIQYAPQDIAKDDSFTKNVNFLKQDPKYQTLPTHMKYIPPSRAGEGQKLLEMNNNNQFIEDYQLPRVLPFNTNTSANSQLSPSLVTTTTISDSGKDVSNTFQPGANLVNTNVNKAVPQGQKPAPPVPVKPPGSNLKHHHHQQQQQSNPHHHQQQQQSHPHHQQTRTVMPPEKPYSVKDSVSDFIPRVSVTSTDKPDGGSGSTPRVPELHGPLPPGSSSSLHPIININEEERQAGSGQSSPAQSEGSDSSGGIQVKNTEINTSSIGPVSAMIERLNQKMGPSSQAAHQTSSAHPNPPTQAHKPPGIPSHSQATAVPYPTPSQNIPSKSIPDSTHPSGYPSSAGSTHPSSVNSTHPSLAGGLPPPSQQQQQNNPPQHPPHLNQKPAPTYRYASKNQIANTYMGRLGSTAMEKYQRNLNMLYRNLDNHASGEQAPPEDPPDGQRGAGPLPAAVPVAADHPQFGAVASPNYPDIASDKGSYKLNTPKHIRRRHSDSENEEMNKALAERQEVEQQRQQRQQQAADQDSKPAPPPRTDIVQTLPALTSLSPSTKEESQGNPQSGKSEQVSPTDKMESSDSTSAPDATSAQKRDGQSGPSKNNVVKRRSKSNLKKEGGRRSTNRVSFDPLALLLDASLEGELDLVRKVAVQVDDVSTANDEGITALHNAICAGHYDIVKFLVEFGCDVNSPDSDGWTPLHCAASCNNLPMVRFLVEHGACVFATTISDQETAADKCEEDEDGYDSCSDYLYSIQEKLGITNNGEVYAVFDYQATNVDELSFVTGTSLSVLRKGDEKEKEWWWSRLNSKDGYIPRNLLGLYPRVVGQAKVSEC